jgi:predicted Zn-dependent protease
MKRYRVVAALLLAGATVLPGPVIVARTTVKQAQPGFNLFTVQQDVEIGRHSAIEAEKQLRLLNDATVDRYLDRVVQRLAARAPGADFPYRIKAVNATEINAFALPGGPMYVNRGQLTSARSEAELAGVLAHEISHVALRHGTHQASKAYLAQAGLGILGGLLGKTSTSSVLNAIGGFGLNAVFLKFSRDDEYEADQTGAQIMAKAGYDPNAMASFFQMLREESGRNPSKLEQFFSSHPPAADREARIRQLASSLGGTGRTQIVGGFDATVSRLRSLPATTTPQQVVTVFPRPQDTGSPCGWIPRRRG